MNDGSPNRPPATQYRLAKLRRVGRMFVHVTEIANDGSRVINLVGDSHFPILTFFAWSEPVRATDWTEEHRFLTTSESRPERRWHFGPHDTAEAVRRAARRYLLRSPCHPAAGPP